MMKRMISRLLVIAVAALTVAVTGCMSESETKLRDAVEKSNAAMHGKYVGDGCYCEGITLQDGTVTYTYAMPGVTTTEPELGDAEFSAYMKPGLIEVFKEALKTTEGREFHDVMVDCNSGVDVVFKFDNRNYTISFTADELASIK